MTNEKNLKILALIGARSGSKGIPHKNIRDFCGKPMVAWIIGAARAAKLVSRVIVSTDSEKYAEVARAHGAEVPFLRPAEISGDKATDIEYIRHALEWFEKNEGYIPDAVLRLVPTAPLQRAEDIDATINALLNDPDADSAMGIAEAQQHPGKALKITPDGKYLIPYMSGSFESSAPILRQSFEKAYFRGNIIATHYATIKNKNSLFGERSAYHIIPAEYAIDVDSELDFLLAEALIKRDSRR